MTVEELMKSRFIVLALYPGCSFKVGDILAVPEFWEAYNMYTNEDYEKTVGLHPAVKHDELINHPHLFRKLSWWEHRAESDLPEYVKLAEHVAFDDLRRANLLGANLRFTNLDDKIYTIARIGTENRQTTFNATKNIIWCGCFTGTIEEFEAQIIKTHNLTGNERHYNNYMSAIAYFKALI